MADSAPEKCASPEMMSVMERVPFYCSQMLNFWPLLKSGFSLIGENMPTKRPLRHYFLHISVLIRGHGDNYCVFSSRWKYGSRTSAPSIKRSWSMAMDQRGSIFTAPTPSPPARPGCPSFGRFPWRTKEATCIQTITWTLLDTGIQTTSLIRTRCPGLRWCEWVVFDVAQTSCSGFDWTCSQS